MALRTRLHEDLQRYQASVNDIGCCDQAPSVDCSASACLAVPVICSSWVLTGRIAAVVVVVVELAVLDDDVVVDEVGEDVVVDEVGEDVVVVEPLPPYT